MSETLSDPVLASLFNQYALELVDMKLQSVDNCNRVLRTMTIAETLEIDLLGTYLQKTTLRKSRQGAQSMQVKLISRCS